MPKVRETIVFADWIKGLRDVGAMVRINQRLRRIARAGDFGDHKYLRDDVSELIFNFGPGYRAYFMTLADGAVVVLLAGGAKGSQDRDIERAIAMARDITENGYEE